MMGRQKGKMQKIHFQIKNCCIDLDLEGNGFTEAGDLTANSPKNRHTTGELGVLPASFPHSAVMHAAPPRAWDGAVEAHRLQTQQSVTLPGCEDQPQRWQGRRSAQVC